MNTINRCSIPLEQIVGLGEFVECTYLPSVKENPKPSTYRGYKNVWESHLQPLVIRQRINLKDFRTAHVDFEGFEWTDYYDGELHVVRSVWNGQSVAPKTLMSGSALPVIRLLGERLELQRLRSGDAKPGPIFSTGGNKPMSLNNILNRQILPALNRCPHCGLSEGLPHLKARECLGYERDPRIPEWQGFHAARRGLGSNLYRLGVSDKVIQRILRHSNVNVTLGCYVKSNSSIVRTWQKQWRSLN